ncbi:polyphosphate kinase 1 [Gorillibacterium massiliense]|uniref:polyphosphate kinase 1 n=1 Tax=Gorillibacterium massiliense TaxID=1280390 RepID=UPI0004BB477D|nr:polyphosphate kinase 1 [Gorillibacterium massiliense]
MKTEDNLQELTRYINRDLSWIEFNRRVLEEAQDKETPLLEKAKFLGITSTNLDEFMSVRVAGLLDLQKSGYNKKDFSGYAPASLLRRIFKRTTGFVTEQYKVYKDIVRQLSKHGIRIHSYNELSQTQQKAANQIYHQIVYPVLTPMAIDQARPFPLITSLGLYLAVVLVRNTDAGKEDAQLHFAIVRVPANFSRLVQVPSRGASKAHFIFLEELMKEHIVTLFNGYTPVSVHAFRLTRNSDLTLDERAAEDLLEEIEKEVRRRRWGTPVRLEVEKGIHPYALEQLIEEFEISGSVFEIEGPLDLGCLTKLPDLIHDNAPLKYPEVQPAYPQEFLEEDSMFDVIRRQDVLLYHPYESFEAVNDFVIEAAEDPYVLAIKITLYRVSGNSLLVRALERAAEDGKQVTVALELKARFDEERNIAWAKRLEKAGCHVVYGLVGLKTHAKVTQIIRQEEEGLRRYMHVGTGNYNENTARLYTDVGLFTSDAEIGEDVSSLFNEITGYSSAPKMNQLIAAPTYLSEELAHLIMRETLNARQGKPARIIAKVNSLSNQEIIDHLYEASQAGVKIDLIIRGVCCLRPGVPGLSETITVRSIIDRFLEHSRLFYFENGGAPEAYLSSADWMTRNLTRRVEVMCPVRNTHTRDTLFNILKLHLKDSAKARHLQANGSFTRPEIKTTSFRSQFEAARIKSWKKVVKKTDPLSKD